MSKVKKLKKRVRELEDRMDVNDNYVATLAYRIQALEPAPELPAESGEEVDDTPRQADLTPGS